MIEILRIKPDTVMMDLFIDSQQDTNSELPNQQQFGQYFSPAFCCDLILTQFFPELDESSLVCDPTCGEGAFLNALPDGVNGFGVEIDPIVAQRAREFTGRTIHTADILDYSPDAPITAMVGNPPFSTNLLTGMLERATTYMVDRGKVGFILSTHMLQASNTVCKWARDWSIETHMIPRDLYPGLSKPLCFTVFTKEAQRQWVGMALYTETRDVNALNSAMKSLFRKQGKGSVWVRIIDSALDHFGGKASLQEIYDFVEYRRPTENKFWKEKIRQIARQKFDNVARGVYAKKSNFQTA